MLLLSLFLPCIIGGDINPVYTNIKNSCVLTCLLKLKLITTSDIEEVTYQIAQGSPVYDAGPCGHQDGAFCHFVEHLKQDKHLSNIERYLSKFDAFGDGKEKEKAKAIEYTIKDLTDFKFKTKSSDDHELFLLYEKMVADYVNERLELISHDDL